MWVDIITVAAFCAITLVSLVFGLSVVRARKRVRNIADVTTREKSSRPSNFRRALAGAVPQFAGEVDSLEQDLRRAGFYGPYSLIEFLSARNFVVIGLMICGGCQGAPTCRWPIGHRTEYNRGRGVTIP